MTIPFETDNMTSNASEAVGSSSTDSSGIIESLKQDNDYFKQIINLVPANFYFDQETRDKLSHNKSGNKAGGQKSGNLASLVKN